MRSPTIRPDLALNLSHEAGLSGNDISQGWLQELRIACHLAEEEVEGGVSQRVSPLAQVFHFPLPACNYPIREYIKFTTAICVSHH